MKHVIYVDEGTIVCLRYNNSSGTVDIGGYARHGNVFYIILRDFFGIEDIQFFHVQRNKIRARFECSLQEYNNAIVEIHNSHMVIEEVKKHDRLMI